ncbi:pantothenate kinase [Fusarium heterosporum]|uniref:Pantothenate kinase n=1 Tax=Fusarium heterosporum TaxID=42747 RepID=A0A8H5TS55_FUSHE|nr:pantothenate kinase [Fusarium heterosporum]
MATSEDYVQDAAVQYLINPLDASHISDGIDGSSHDNRPPIPGPTCDIFKFVDEAIVPSTPPTTNPYLLVNIGSGVSFFQVSESNQCQRISGSSFGGSALCGLLLLLTRARTYEDMLEQAEKGNNANVDKLIGDIYGMDYNRIGMKMTAVASTFCKAFSLEHRPEAEEQDPTNSVQDIKSFSDADICHSLVFAVFNNIGQLATLHSRIHNDSDIYFTGPYIQDCPLIIRTLCIAEATATIDRFYRSSLHPGSSSQNEDPLLQTQVCENFVSYGDSEWNASQNNEGHSAPGSYNDYPRSLQQDEFSFDQSYDPQYFDNQYYDPLSYNNQYHPQASYIPSANDQSFWQSGFSGSRAYAGDSSASFGQRTVTLSYDAPVSSTQAYNSQPVQELRGFLPLETGPSGAQATASRGQETYGLNPVRGTLQAPTSSNPKIYQGSNPFDPVVPAEPAGEERGPGRPRRSGNKGRASTGSTNLPVDLYPFTSRMSME